ncbi:MAG: regulatory iron-sulfur-containing complex subunit RicT [Candidatus Berkelbacteria bacterium]|nr:regulatory iron-sulfur-containing complex subunit RicT [Candidatus Berkelbacteria bacterium]
MKTFLIKFRTTSRVYQFSSSIDYKIGDRILIDTNQGIEVGTILEVKNKKSDLINQEIDKLDGKILRKMTDEDEKRIENLDNKGSEALEFCQERIKALKLSMKLLNAEYSLDEKKLTFYFSAEDRIDFRELLAELVAHYHKNIRLQQLGPRDVAKIIGGIGPCGRPLCCQTYLENMESVSLEMAKEQDLVAVGSNKISGACGKLMCCLLYEVATYQRIRKGLPKIDEKIKTDKGVGKVITQNVLKQSVLVELEDGTKIEHKVTEDKKS